MRFMVIKAKYIVFALACAILLPLCFMYASRAVSVFNSAETREVPIYCVQRSDSKIAVTFDCAWNDSDIDAILKTLDIYDCRATFFIVGDWAEKYPQSLLKIYNAGHEIGAHSYNHSDYTKLDAAALIADMEKCDEAIAAVTGEKPRLVRAPSGGWNETVVRVCRERQTPCIQWSVDGIDYGNADPEGIIRRAAAATKAGDIILLHNGTEHTAEVLPEILEKLSKTYEFSTVSDMIYTENYTIDHTGMQIPE
ncbi:MAG TPA: polysaccharide deacetylase family protein [Candidatus Ornithomonoglobus intestinigallinarum]|uniref:Polysaccharide deacetylase family protein n=1 Tax=Candidatus Ornithomonoglobus intestinigallinarum TaxID=2840894 RepID=A0A9D1KRE3_9FIRM|nr:polysaccharide deacetylase family protein [Candidatus Ornithomonoglobus intestinigallinarum]